jgi:hypothetical protein
MELICLHGDSIVFLHGHDGSYGLLQEHQESILGSTMQSVIALLNNLVACKDSNMKLLYEQGKCILELISYSDEFCPFVCFLFFI